MLSLGKIFTQERMIYTGRYSTVTFPLPPGMPGETISPLLSICDYFFLHVVYSIGIHIFLIIDYYYYNYTYCRSGLEPKFSVLVLKYIQKYSYSYSSTFLRLGTRTRTCTRIFSSTRTRTQVHLLSTRPSPVLDRQDQRAGCNQV